MAAKGGCHGKEARKTKKRELAGMSSGRMQKDYPRGSQGLLQYPLQGCTQRQSRHGHWGFSSSEKGGKLRSWCSVHCSWMRQQAYGAGSVQHSLPAVAEGRGRGGPCSRQGLRAFNSKLQGRCVQGPRLQRTSGQSLDVQQALPTKGCWDHRRGREEAQRPQEERQTPAGLAEGAGWLHPRQSPRRAPRCES